LLESDGVFDGLPSVRTDARRIMRTANRHDVDVDLRRKSPVEPQLLLAEEAPTLERGEVEEVELDRLLDLVSEVPGQQHPGDVRFLQLDCADRMRVCIRLQQSFDETARSFE